MFRNIIAVNGEGDLLSFVEDFSGVFFQQVVELIVTEEQVEVVEELSLVFVLRELLDELFISKNLNNS